MEETTKRILTAIHSIFEHIEDKFSTYSITEKLEISRNLASLYENKLITQALATSLMNTIKGI